MPKEKSESYGIVDFPTETEPRIQNNETKETYTLTEAICQVLNELKELRKVMG